MKTTLQILVGVTMCVSSLAQRPIITSVDRIVGPNGEIVTIQGSGFGTNANDLAVFFGAAKAPINFVSEQLIEAVIPAGATYDKISVARIASGLSTYTRANFLMSFGGEPGITAAKFEGQVNFDAESGLYDLCLCDFDRDGKNDVITANDNANSMTLLANTTSAPGLATTSFNKIPILINARTIHVTCGDLNGDGKPEIVASEGGTIGDRVFIFHNNSSGPGNFSFTPQFVKLTGKKVKRVKIADLDGDGKPEIAVTNQSANNITILVNQSTTSTIAFSSTPVTVTVPDAASTDGLTVDDINGDQLPDLITSQFLTTTSNIFILKNTSSTGNVSFGETTKLSVGGTVVNLKVGDLDGDNKPDIAATQLLGSTISIFANQSSTSTIAFGTAVPITVEERPWGIEFGDLDGDGKPDIAIASLTKKTLTLLRNQSTPGTFNFPVITKATTFINRHLMIGDIDGDAKPDIAFTSVDDNSNNIPASKVSIFRNTTCQKPVLGPEGPHNICSGFSLDLSTNEVAGTTYEWNDGTAVVASGTDPLFNVTASGSYTVTAISESGACALTSNAVTVTVGAGTTTGTAAPTNNGPICIGSTMTLSVNDVGGTDYQWTGPNGYTGSGTNPAPVANFQAVNAGRYFLDVIVGGCIAQQVSTVVDAVAVPDFQVSSGTSSVVCPPATKTLTLSPNVSTFSYQWFEETTGIISGATSASFTASNTGNYYVEATYIANPGCATVQTESINVTFASAPVADFTLPSTACRGEVVTFANTSTTDAGVAPTYAWQFGDGQTSSDEAPTHTYATASTFNVTLTVSYENGACTDTETKSITVQAAPALTISSPGNTFALCDGDTLALSVQNTFASYLWSTGATTSSIEITAAGTYAVEAESSQGCTITASQEITSLPAPELIVTADPPEIAEGETAQLTASGAESYLWNASETLSSTDIADPVASPLTNTIYTVTGMDANGCSATTTIEVLVREGSIYGKIQPAKFFSPDNGDEIGSFWNVQSIENYPGCAVSIYDIKGIKVFEAKPYLNDWDGTFNGKRLPDGVYYFIIRCEGDQNPPKTGSVTILR